MKPSVIEAGQEKEYLTDERCHILELSNSEEDPAVSIARARVEPGLKTRLHRLKGTVERYVILQGTGLVEVGDLVPTGVEPGNVVLIPADTPQSITNTGRDDLIFLAICTPRFKQENYDDLESFREFFLDHSLQELKRPDGFIREFFLASKKIHLLIDRHFLIKKVYFINFAAPDLIWLLIPGGSYSAFRIEREPEERYFYTGGVLGTRVKVDLPKADLEKEIEAIRPDLLRSKIRACLDREEIYLNETPFQEDFITYYIEGRPFYSQAKEIIDFKERSEEEQEDLRRYFGL